MDRSAHGLVDGSIDGVAHGAADVSAAPHPDPDPHSQRQPVPVPSDAVALARIERPVPVMREWLIVIAPLIALAVGLLKMSVAADSGQFWAGVVTAAIGFVLVAVGVLAACRRIRSLRAARD